MNHVWSPWKFELSEQVARCSACGVALWVDPNDEIPKGAPSQSVSNPTPKSTGVARAEAITLIGDTCPGPQPETRKKRAHSFSLSIPPQAEVPCLECACDLLITPTRHYRHSLCRAR
jgi:hypothetical protein